MGRYFTMVLPFFALAACRQPAVKNIALPVISVPPAVIRDTVNLAVRAGETMDAILRNLDLAGEEFSSLLQGVMTHFHFPIHQGQSWRAVFLRNPLRLESFVLEAKAGDKFHHLVRGDSGLFSYEEEVLPVVMDTSAVSGALQGNLFDAFISIGETPALVDAVTQIFAWDIDFFRDPRVGDSFQVLVEKKMAMGNKFLGYGKVLAARYLNSGHSFDAVLQGGRYFGADGRSLEKRLMKAPLHFYHISSGFSRSRLHPVLGVRRPHWGVDYAGPTGTPILAAGDGVVVYAEWHSGYGKTIKIRHNGVYSTYYAHLNGYAQGITKGRRVTQAQVIGYMGMTGLATGPHLDYRVEKNGGFINPVNVVSEPMQGIPAGEWTAFTEHRDRMFDRMSGVKTQLASAEIKKETSNAH